MKKKMFQGAIPIVFEHAKAMRVDPTHSELLMWEYLRQRPLGYKFRRQHPMGLYIADFYCHQLKLIIEIDGNIHNKPEVILHDKERQERLEKDGMKFLRFTNEQIEKQIELVVQITEQRLKEMTPFSDKNYNEK